MNPAIPPSSPENDAIEAAASAWLARRDRGFTGAEQDEFLQWCRSDARHRAVLQRLELSWNALDQLARWRPEHAAQPNPDLLRQPVPSSRRAWHHRSAVWAGVATLSAVAAALVVAVMRPVVPSGAEPAALTAVATTAGAGSEERAGEGTAGKNDFVFAAVAQRATLPDGSVVDLNAGARLDYTFGPTRRDVRLVAGEAHFSVVSDATRPFVVHARHAMIRAVGTAFNVNLGADQVEVLVTHGRVAVDEVDMASGPGADPLRVTSGALLSAGERTVIPLSGEGAHAAPVVTTVPAAEIAAALSWQPRVLEFPDTPLSDIVPVFNRSNVRQLELADAELADLRIAGTFRVDNVDAFVRLLEAGFGVSAEVGADGVTRLRARP